MLTDFVLRAIRIKSSYAQCRIIFIFKINTVIRFVDRLLTDLLGTAAKLGGLKAEKLHILKRR